MPEQLKSRVAELRDNAGLTQVQLAALVGVTPNTVQNWEKDNGLDQLEKYLKLCEIFGLEKLEDLFERIELPEESKPQTKGFSLEQLREIRASWGTDVKTKTARKKHSDKKQKSLVSLQKQMGTEETAETNSGNSISRASKPRR